MVIAWTVAISSSLETGTRTYCPGCPTPLNGSHSYQNALCSTSPLKSASDLQFLVIITGWPTYHDVAVEYRALIVSVCSLTDSREAFSVCTKNLKFLLHRHSIWQLATPPSGVALRNYQFRLQVHPLLVHWLAQSTEHQNI